MDNSKNAPKHYSKIKVRIENKLKYEIGLIKCLKSNGNIPLVSKIFLTLAIVYLLSPIDLIPDFIPVIGALDDMIIVIPLIWLAYFFIPKDAIDRCKLKIEKEGML
ncbi:MAG: DUF1232 domain-containing protein [Proteobacteria bacterium]|nr:DUF1232 domain-containing protein [Pseudomonadota bacterium]